MRPGPGLVVMALAFISGAWRGSTSTSQQQKTQSSVSLSDASSTLLSSSTTSLSPSASSPLSSSSFASSKGSSILFLSFNSVAGGALSSSSSSSSSIVPPPQSKNNYHLYNIFPFTSKSSVSLPPPQRNLLPEQLRHHHEPRRKIPPTSKSLSLLPISTRSFPNRVTREVKIQASETVVKSERSDGNGSSSDNRKVTAKESHLHSSSSSPIKYLKSNSGSILVNEDEFVVDENLISEETDIADSSNFEQLQFDKFRYTNAEDYSDSGTRDISENNDEINSRGREDREISSSIVTDTLNELFSDSVSSLKNTVNENHQDIDFQDLGDNPVFESSSSLIRLNPWISACDLAQPNSAPDLQGQCSAGTLPVAWVDEGPGPPTCPQSCQNLKIKESIYNENNFNTKNYLTNSHNNKNRITTSNKSIMSLKIRRDAAAAMFKMITSKPKITTMTTAKTDSLMVQTSSAPNPQQQQQQQQQKQCSDDEQENGGLEIKKFFSVPSYVGVDNIHSVDTNSSDVKSKKNNHNRNNDKNISNNDNNNNSHKNDSKNNNNTNNIKNYYKVNYYNQPNSYSHLNREESENIYSSSRSNKRSDNINNNNYDSNNKNNNNSEQPRIQKQQQQQCLDYLGDNDESSPTQLCKIKSPSELAKKLRSLRLKHCCERTVFSALHTIAINKTINGGQNCVKILTDIADLDSLATRITCELAEILFRYDCRQIYSLIHQCKDCKEAYRRWVCSTLIPYFAEEISPMDDDLNSQSDINLKVATTQNSNSEKKQKRENNNRMNSNHNNHYNRDNGRKEENNNQRKGRSTPIVPEFRSPPPSPPPHPLSTSVAEGFSSIMNINRGTADNEKMCYFSNRFQNNKSLQYDKSLYSEFISTASDERNHIKDPTIPRLLKRTKRKVDFRKRRRMRPCMSVCQTVEQKCPYLLPGDRAPAYPTQYAGEPTFLCLDPNIPETGEQLRKSNHGPSNCCYRYCGPPEQGICTFCDDFHHNWRPPRISNSEEEKNITDLSFHQHFEMGIADNIIGSTTSAMISRKNNATTVTNIEDLNKLRYFAKISGTYYYDDIDEMPTEPITECQPVPSVTSRCTIPYYASSAPLSSFHSLPHYIFSLCCSLSYIIIFNFYLSIIESFSPTTRQSVKTNKTKQFNQINNNRNRVSIRIYISYRFRSIAAILRSQSMSQAQNMRL